MSLNTKKGKHNLSFVKKGDPKSGFIPPKQAVTWPFYTHATFYDFIKWFCLVRTI